MRPQELFPSEITITEEHIALLQAACVDWCGLRVWGAVDRPKAAIWHG
jgi:hypothetical protein